MLGAHHTFMKLGRMDGPHAGIITPITQSKLSRAWVATEGLDEVDRLKNRLADTGKAD